MTYRDEGTATAAKVDELEAKLAEANATIQRLEGTVAEGAPGGETLGPPTSIGAPSFATHVVDLDHVLSPEGYEAIAGVLEQRLGLRASQVGSSLTAPGHRFRLTVEGGRTRITLRNDWTTAARGVPISARALGALVGGFGGLVAIALAHDVGHLGEAMAAANFLWAAPLGYGVVSSLWGRTIGKRTKARIEGELAAQRGTAAAIVELAARHRSDAPVKARVEVSALEETDEAGDGERTHRNAR